jgi:hypothetical protein
MKREHLRSLFFDKRHRKQHRTIEGGIGDNQPQEAPQAFAGGRRRGQ